MDSQHIVNYLWHLWDRRPRGPALVDRLLRGRRQVWLLGGDREGHGRVPRLVPSPPAGERSRRSAGARLSPDGVGLGAWVRGRGEPDADPESVRRPRRPPGVRHDHGGECGATEGHWEGRTPIGPGVPPAVAGLDRRRGAGRCRVRD